jgi:hypothetical protein
MSSLFLSHSHKDKGFVRLLAADLRSAGVHVWYGEDEIRVGDPLTSTIETALGTVKYVGACLSPNAIVSKWVTHEINVAMKLETDQSRIVLLPLLIMDCQIPPALTDKIRIDFRNPDRYEAEFHDLLLRLTPEERSDPRTIFVIDDFRRKRLVGAARSFAEQEGMQDWVVDYLIKARVERNDGSERYWINIALGEIGGAKALAAVREGVSDEDDFARSGAKAALSLMGLS